MLDNENCLGEKHKSDKDVVVGAKEGSGSKDPRGEREGVTQRSGGRAFQREGTAGAKF